MGRDPGASTGAPPAGEERTGASERLNGVLTPEQLASFVEGQARILELVARSAPLRDTLAELVRVLERQAEGMLCSVLLLSEDGRRVRHGAAPSLPASFVDAIEDEEIGPCAGSCGTAAFLRRQVIVADVAVDPLWERYREVALAAGLRACWSTPILSRNAEVLGTFAIYYREPTSPTTLHLTLIGLATHLAGIAIEQSQVEHERQRLVTELDAQRRALETAGKQKDQFLGMLSHELRNPLAAIGNAVALARLRLSRGLDVEGPLTVLERQVRNSSRLLEDLLDVARITRGVVQLHKAPLPLDEVVAGAVEGQRALIESRRHRLVVSMPPAPTVLEGDATRLEQVISNLLNNAAKYSPEGSQLQLRVERGSDSVVIRVRDDGQGIPAELLPHVFDPFVQADRSLARSQGGLGLGLALVQNLVALHGGTVHAFSEGEGRGSEFVVTLPVPQEALQAEPAQRESGTPWRATSSRILVVEDNQDAAAMLGEALFELGYELEIAHDGAAALEAVRRDGFQVVLLDIGLPVMDGYEVARRIQAELGPRAPTLIALSGYGQEEDRRRARDAGIQHHLTKPVTLAEVQRLIEGVLHSSSAGASA